MAASQEDIEGGTPDSRRDGGHGQKDQGGERTRKHAEVRGGF